MDKRKGPEPIQVDITALRHMMVLGVSKIRMAKNLKISTSTLYRIIEREGLCLV